MATAGQTVFAYLTTAQDNRVVTMRFDGASLTAPSPILTGIPAGSIHDGGRMAFGPDGKLYVTTGESGDPGLSQDRSSLGGKILRINPDGTATVFTGKVELGQGILTSLAQIAAEELDLPIAKLKLISGDTGQTPNEGMTAGSQSIENSGLALRLAGAQQCPEQGRLPGPGVPEQEHPRRGRVELGGGQVHGEFWPGWRA